MSDRVLRMPEVILTTGLSRSTIYAEISKGNFPKQLKLTGGRSSGWLESSVSEWLTSKSKK